MLRGLMKISTAFFMAAVVLQGAPLHAGTDDVGDVEQLLEKADELGRKIDIPKNLLETQGKEEAQKTADYFQSEAFRKKYEAEVERLKTTVFKDTLDSYYGDAAAGKTSGSSEGTLPANERIYVFISSSIPTETLRNYVRDLDRLHDPHVFMVMRGFVGGMKYLKPTLTFVREVIANAGCEEGATCKRRQVGIKIDPLLFRRYGIDRVPAVVYIPNIRIADASMSEGMEKNAKTGEHYTLYGDASLPHFLEVFQSESKSRSIESLLALLKGGLYHQEKER